MLNRLAWVIVFSISIGSSFAQFKNTKLDERTKDNLACEPSISS
jgi:hypothetical protein